MAVVASSLSSTIEWPISKVTFTCIPHLPLTEPREEKEKRRKKMMMMMMIASLQQSADPLEAIGTNKEWCAAGVVIFHLFKSLILSQSVCCSCTLNHLCSALFVCLFVGICIFFNERLNREKKLLMDHLSTLRLYVTVCLFGYLSDLLFLSFVLLLWLRQVCYAWPVDTSSALYTPNKGYKKKKKSLPHLTLFIHLWWLVVPCLGASNQSST